MRVISGEARGRTLKSVPGSATRPTADRVRQTIYDILGSVRGKDVLDLFAGTGALGLEALSRGASSARFVESSPIAARVIRSNIEMLGYQDRATVSELDVRKLLLGRIPIGFDLIFCDPPYQAGVSYLGGVLKSLGERGWVAPGGMVVVESASGASFEKIGDLTEIRRKTFGQTQVTFLTRAKTS
ncbi:MAG: 16S rRNA (guanine(966)-N(2))-methyltransferase RsmD [Actinomycetota bacterium]